MRDELALLGAQLTYKKRLESMLKELRTQEQPLAAKVARLEARMVEERKDVDRLEGRSLAAFVYYALGKKEERLDIERREYYAARVKYDAAARELEAIRQDIEATEEDLQDLQDCESRYTTALEQKRLAIEQSGLPEAEEILKKGRSLNQLCCQEQELDEALAAGNAALLAADNVADSLRSAVDWSTLDLLGGGALVDAAKHEKLDEAQKNIEELQVNLQKFNTELADVTIRANVQVSIDAMLKFADFFFDNIFTDAAVMDRVKQAHVQVEHTRDQILGVLRQLQTKLDEVRHGQVKAKAELDALVVQAEL